MLLNHVYSLKIKKQTSPHYLILPLHSVNENNQEILRQLVDGLSLIIPLQCINLQCFSVTNSYSTNWCSISSILSIICKRIHPIWFPFQKVKANQPDPTIPFLTYAQYLPMKWSSVVGKFRYGSKFSNSILGWFALKIDLNLWSRRSLKFWPIPSGKLTYGKWQITIFHG